MDIDIKILAPILIVQLILIIIAMRDLIGRDASRVRGGNKILWGAIIILGNLLGPIVYLFAGKKD